MLSTLVTVAACFIALTSTLSIRDYDRNPSLFGGYGYNPGYVNYTVVPGLFQQDDPATNASTFNFTASNFGLIDRTYPTDSSCENGSQATQWQRLAHYIRTLNNEAPRNVEYKLLYMGRHGEGWHNAAESYYGTPAWNCFWSEKDGNGTAVWADAHLTANGIKQALAVNAFWAKEMAEQKIPVPESYYTSPLSRCLATANLTFSGLALPREHPFVPQVKELFREGISGHTCDRRSSKTYIHDSFPWYTFEAGFTEDDELWEALHGETSQDEDIRSKKVLDDVFTHDKSTYISITSHSGEIASLLRVLGHRVFSLSTGAAIPVLVRAEALTAASPSPTIQPFTALSTCAVAPTIRASTCNDCSCCS
ncbi:phosphoglycerate mutase-like protein [Lepidopterella palustris CBS 459.81]|uniref:Phosphoglycerate mutase-like protein n=1 Tax=Lepidopterella palustris CBS 459.81 TaxID=1314670 RepID=A0A8E2JHI7_9PEZI|nr:phosphoglycerate mutase-like protein [Lepidopterella palustris CBS 459.81]